MKQDDKIIHSWCMYDWANSAFATTVMAAVLPSFYSSVAGSGLAKNTISSYWGYTNTIAMLLTALSAPILGAISDHYRAKKRFLAVAAGLGILATSLLVLVSTGDWMLASLLYIIGRFGFSGANIFYDSLLPHIVDDSRVDSISARGYAYGYSGGGVLLLINLLMIMKPDFFGIPGTEWGVRLSFISVAVWWAFFSLPLFKNVPEPNTVKFPGEESNPIVAGFKRLRATFKEIRKYRQLLKFIIAFWAYNDGIGTIITMAVIFGAEIGIGQTHLIGAILLVQFAGIPFSLLFGRLPGKFGTKNCILFTIFVYIIITIMGYFMQSSMHFWMLAFMVATVQGGAQALSRSMFSTMVPKGRSGEFFGFYEVSNKFAGIFGPAVFGIVGQISGSSRLGILALIIFFIAGGLLLCTVNHEEGILAAKNIP